MNNNRIFWIAFIVGLWSLPAATADDLVARPQAGMKWTVKIQPPGSRNEKSNTGQTKNELSTEPDREEENVMGRNLRREAKVMNDGNTLVRYASEGLILYIDSRTGEPAIQGSDESAYGGALRTDAFDEFVWVEKRWHQGQQKIDGRLCDVFIGPWPAKSLSDPIGSLPLDGTDGRQPDTKTTPPTVLNAMKSVQTAFIDKDTRLPVLLESPAEVRRYVFSPGPSSLELPRELSDALEKRKAAILWRRQRFDIPQ